MEKDYAGIRHEEEIEKADNALFNGTGYVVHQYISLLKDIRKLLININPNDLEKFVHDIYMLFYEHKHRPHYTGEWLMPDILVPILKDDELFAKLESATSKRKK